MRRLLPLFFLAACSPGQLSALGAPPEATDGDIVHDVGPHADGQVHTPDVGASDLGSTPDTAAPDAGPPPPDASPDDCPGGCGPNAYCTHQGCVCEDGFERRDGLCMLPEAPCPDGCGVNARCEANQCVCAPGFELRDGACQAPEPEPCAAGCGPNAHCDGERCVCDAGFEPAADGCTPIPQDPCDDQNCGMDARCVDGLCVCRAGFVQVAGGCGPPPMGPLQARSEAEVCERWAQFSVGAGVTWVATPGSDDPCDPGTVTDTAQDAAIGRTNIYRWLVGLNPVGLDASRLQMQQECAAMLNAYGSLTHSPTPDVPCYTAGAAAGAGSSNLAMGGTIDSSVDMYVGDRGVASLGHRRWVLNPGMRATTFGQKARWGCMYSFSSGGTSVVDVVAWPPPGFVPTSAAQGTGSITLHRVSAGEEFRVEIATGDGPWGALEVERLGGNYGGGTTYAYTLPGGIWADEQVMRLALRGLRDHADMAWTTQFTSCR